MLSPKLLILDNALNHQIYRPVEHWSKALGFVSDHIHVPSGATLPPVGNHTHVILTGSEAQGSLEECRYNLILSRDLGYGDPAELMSQLEEVSKLLSAYLSSILNFDS